MWSNSSRMLDGGVRARRRVRVNVQSLEVWEMAVTAE